MTIARLRRWAPNLDEIRNDPVVGTYFWCVLATHLVTWAFFIDTRILRATTSAVEPLCWPYFESCWQFRLTGTGAVGLAQFSYMAIAFGGMAAVSRGHLRLAWICALSALLFTLVSLDYRLRANEFYMLFWLNVVFLFWPRRRWSVPLVIVSFYFWAGTLKLNAEWLSGAGLYAPLWGIPASMTWLACAYVVLLELVLVWGLLSARAWLRWITLVQLALFHLQSLTQIHWFYPALMAIILSWFVIDGRLAHPAPARSRLRDLFTGKAPRMSYALVGVFASLQLAPHVYGGNPVFTGQGRILALHMFQARFDCQVLAQIRYRDGSTEDRDLRLRQLPPRTTCDPIVYFNRAQNICRSEDARGIDDLRFVMRIKRLADPGMTDLIDAERFCAARHDYRVFSRNTWLKLD